MRVYEEFQRLFKKSEGAAEESFCPYRVCPLGAHVDHQYGLVTGFAINRGVTIVFAPTSGIIRLHSLNFEGETSFSLNKIPPKQNNWGDYLRGAASALTRYYPIKHGLNGVIEGTLPVGGLSSSAALIISFLAALCRVNHLKISRSELIQIALEAETLYVGIHVGKLDQSCEVFCQKDHLLFLDTKDEKYELIPRHPGTPPFEIAIFFSGVERSLAGSAFNIRVDELKAASYALKGWSGMESGKFIDSRLRDVPVEVFEKYADLLPENWRKRAAHYYSEVERVRHGAEAWRCGDLARFGKLIFESGRSSIEQYETGSDELKKIYEIMLETEGVYGGRFSGAGFKGCCMALIDPSCRQSITEKMTREYLQTFPYLEGKFSIHFCETANGVQI